MLRGRSIFVLINIVALLLSMQGTLAYAPETTHAGLTQEMIALYETIIGNQFTPAERELIIQASIDEDNPPVRALNHFYDPIYDRGINDYRTSYRWATDELTGNEFTWNAGIAAYARGDRYFALVVLGHVLHLIEDSAVPDHTRNDPHMGHGASGLWTGASPFEDWADREKTRMTLEGYGAALAKMPPWNDPDTLKFLCDTLIGCFKYIATYSNGNFFSEDTIAHPDYMKPQIISGDDFYVFIKDELTGKKEKAYLLDKRNGEFRVSLSNDSDFSVLSSYFDRLAPQAIATGARVIDLFLKEGEMARERLKEKRQQEHDEAVRAALRTYEYLTHAGLFRQFGFGFTELFLKPPATVVKKFAHSTVNAAKRGMRAYAIVFGGVRDSGVLGVSSIQRGTSYAAAIAKEKYVAIAEAGQAATKAGARYVVVGARESAAQWEELSRRLAEALATLEQIRAEMDTEKGEVLGVSSEGSPVQQPDYPHVASPPSPPHFSSVGSIGGGDPPPRILILGVAEGSASLPPLLSTTTLDTEDVVQEHHGNDAFSANDTESPHPPQIESVNGVPYDGDESLVLPVGDVHLTGTAESSSTITLEWSDGDSAHLLVFVTGEDGAWDYHIRLPEGTTTLTLIATDAAGNASHPRIFMLTIDSPHPPVVTSPERLPEVRELVINELAPRGTMADHDDEWIELHNATHDTLQLDNVTLCIHPNATATPCRDGGMTIPLVGTLPPRGYYLITRAHADHQSIFTDVIPNLTAPFTLPDDGATVALVMNGGDDVIDFLPYCAIWCGKGGEGVALERWRIDQPSDDYVANWGTPLEELSRGTDRVGHHIIGTPGARNSLNYLLTLSRTIDTDLTLSAEVGGYLVNGTPITLPAGKTLTLLPGVVIKFRPGQTVFAERSLLEFYGPLFARGTPAAPIIMTTTADDRVGNDLLNDGAPEDYTTLERAGGVDFFDGSDGTMLEHVEFRLLASGVSMNNTSATMTSVAIVDSAGGLELARSVVEGNDLLLHNVQGDAIHLYDGATLALASSSIAAIGQGGNALDIVESTLTATHLTVADIDGHIALTHASTTFAGLTLAAIRGMPDIAATGGTTTITHAALSGLPTTDDPSVEHDHGIVALAHASLSIASSTIAHYAGAAVAAFSESRVTIASSTLTENGTALSVFPSATGEIHGAAIIGNDVGVHNTDLSIELDATHNYWGSSEPPALGDAQGNVVVYPYYVENPIGAEVPPPLADQPMLM